MSVIWPKAEIRTVSLNNSLEMNKKKKFQLSPDGIKQLAYSAKSNFIQKISSVRDWRSTPLEWLSSSRDIDLDLHTAYCRASVIDLYLHTKCHWNRKNFFVDGLTARVLQVRDHVTQKTREI